MHFFCFYIVYGTRLLIVVVMYVVTILFTLSFCTSIEAPLPTLEHVYRGENVTQ